MVISFRVSTLAALSVGLLVGVFIGAIGAQQIAKHWPGSEVFEPIKKFPAPSPITIGKSVNGDVVLCDKDGFAYVLVDYGYGYDSDGLRHNDEERMYPAWQGLQELEPLLNPSTKADESEPLQPNHQLKDSQQKCR